MSIRVYCYSSHGNTRGMWAYCVEYFEEDGNTGNAIWNSDLNEVNNTTLLQMQFNSVLEAFWYLNSLTYAKKPDTQDVVVYISSGDVVRMLKHEYEIKDKNHLDRTKVERLYHVYCAEIWKETSNWNVTYEVVDDTLPDWILQKQGWLGK